MYIDKSVCLPKLPPPLDQEVRKLTEYYDKEDVCAFLLLEEVVCSGVKQAVIDKQLTREEGLMIFDYFGLR